MREHKNVIVTLMWNKWELTERLLDGLMTHEGGNIDEIYVIDNGSEPRLDWLEFHNYIEERKSNSTPWCMATQTNFIIGRLETNVGFTLGANYGLQKVCDKMAEKKLVFLISNDVQINGKFINQAEDILLGAKRALVGNRHIDWDSGWNRHSDILFDYLEGYFLAATSDGWRDLNYFDPNYAPFDFEDLDLSATAKKKGYKLVSLNNPNIVHQNGGTIGFNPEREKITRRNMEYFKRKWTDAR